MLKRNRLYKKYKCNKTIEHYESFNEIRTKVRKSEKSFFKSSADKLKSSSLATPDYWKTLKLFIKPSSDSSIPPIFNNGSYIRADISDNSDKARLLNDFNVSQILLDDSAATLPKTDLLANPTLKETRSVTMNIFRNFLFLFK